MSKLHKIPYHPEYGLAHKHAKFYDPTGGAKFTLATGLRLLSRLKVLQAHKNEQKFDWGNLEPQVLTLHCA